MCVCVCVCVCVCGGVVMGVDSPFKNISFLSSRSNIRGGQKPDNTEKKTSDIPLQNLVSHM